MASKKRESQALSALREASLEAPTEDLSLDPEVDEGEAVEEKVRKPKQIDPAIAALFAPGASLIAETVAAASKTWREATEREAPSIERLAVAGVVSRIDVDAASGYVSVVTEEDTWRAFLPRELLSAVVGLILRRPLEEVSRVMAEGPGSIKARPG